MLIALVQLVLDSLGLIMQAIVFVLPVSPFVVINNMVAVDSSIMQQVNFFLPFAEIVAALQIWVVAYAGYLVFMVVGRWSKLFN